jgi:hypothetical protein
MIQKVEHIFLIIDRLEHKSINVKYDIYFLFNLFILY